MTTSSQISIMFLVLGCIATAAPGTARASWDSFEARSARIHIVHEQTELADDPQDLVRIATWLQRIEALLPAGARVEVRDHRVVVCKQRCPGGVNASWRRSALWAGDLSSLFVIVAEEVGASSAEREQALARSGRAFTVQVLETTDPDEAENLAEELNTLGLPIETFVEVGGFPSPDEIARVVEVDGGDGLTFHRVELGAFLARSDAEAARAELAQTTGMLGTVLSWESPSRVRADFERALPEDPAASH